MTTNRQTGQQLLEGQGLAVMGDVYVDLGNHDQAVHHYQASLTIRQEIGDRQGEGWMLHALARVYAAQGMDSEAHRYTTRASAAADAPGCCGRPPCS